MFNLFGTDKMKMVAPEDALPGRPTPMPITEPHFLSGRDLRSPLPEGMAEAMFGMGCFWGVERKFWQRDGVWLTMVGYAGGYTPNPTYKETCTQLTGHNEVVRLIFDPAKVSYAELLRLFWENHDPTQGDRQGNDVGNQYRSLIMTFTDLQESAAEASKIDYDNRLAVQGMDKITTQIVPAGPFWPAHEAHQQYLEKNPDGYCGLKGTGVQASIPNPDPI